MAIGFGALTTCALEGVVQCDTEVMLVPQGPKETRSLTKSDLTRRGLLGLLAAVLPLPQRIGRAGAAQQEHNVAPGTRVDRWNRTHDRVWLGERFWANPMEDWRVVDGAAEVQTSGGDRNVHLITRRLTGKPGQFRMSVRCRRVEVGDRDGGVGFRIGVRNLIDDHRSNCFARGVGVDAGLVGGRLVLGGASSQAADGDAVAAEGISLVLEGRTEGQDCELSLMARTVSGAELGNLTHTVQAADIAGNVAIVSNFGPGDSERRGGALPVQRVDGGRGCLRRQRGPSFRADPVVDVTR